MEDIGKNIIAGTEASKFSRVAKQSQVHHDEEGREILDGTPIAPPIGYKPTKSIAEQVREMVRSEHLRLAAESAGMETFEEADDFDVGDDYDPSSPFELIFEGVPAEPPAPPRKPGEGEESSAPTPSPEVPKE